MTFQWTKKTRKNCIEKDELDANNKLLKPKAEDWLAWQKYFNEPLLKLKMPNYLSPIVQIRIYLAGTLET